MSDDRNLTDADVKAVAEEVRRGLIEELHLEVGKGVIGWIKKVVTAALIVAALYLYSIVNGKGG